MTRLAGEFTSLYRLFLRTISASVLHHPQATRNLRRLWRPAFEAGARVTKELQQSPCDSSHEHHTWLKLWNERVNNTLALLYNSSQTRGLAHNLTRNLAWLVSSEQQRVRAYRLKAWDPKRPHALTNLTEKARKKQEEENKFKDFVARSWAPLNRAVELAEAKDDLTLGRIRVRGWKAKFLHDRGL
ncbi:hypothetical protein M378DRAFT_186943 [Amanita muscaria Koide BX008]|uniref:Uncharacterized protein n=1 Tax=Amanita muscaria (strain Koide BX008) TaxID=946122 RepID=A0A0C2SKI2_AMAMK|nr:hypothetical protein M378DRAFT_186943 [Amanita muscaria Koide BX008]